MKKIPREDFERWIERDSGRTLGEHALAGYTIRECTCGGPMCLGWVLEDTGPPELFTEDGCDTPVSVDSP